MQINYTAETVTSLIQLTNYIEAKNTAGAGLRWLNRYESFLQMKLSKPGKIKLCNNLTFNKLKLRCLHFNDWIIAFSVHEDFVLIETLLHKSRIVN